ncbi:AI-2E family transporter, partial [Ornithinicoccus halotolerans]|uniref:AI-2E family transporter n=1 Tax=Ornithinicoccus halotolerans TaxID=1748220 RepID=UPI001E3B7218
TAAPGRGGPELSGTPGPATAAGSAAPPPAAAPGSVSVSVSSPFAIGFLGALGVLTAWLLVSNLTRLSSVLTFLLVAVFLTLALNPLVEGLTRRGASRPVGVLVVFLGLLGVLGLVGYLVVPPVVQQSAMLVERAPQYVESVLSEPWVADLDARYGVGDRVIEEVNDQLTDSGFLATLFGGVLGAAGWLASGLIGVVTVLILTLYLLAALPAVKDAAYRAVPASNRSRVIALAEEIMRRVGGYALGQALVATINGTCSWVVLELLGLPYPVVLAFTVGVLGLVPLIGATLGATIVAAVALFQDPTLALVVVVYYVVYQQVENYVVVPRVMQRTVSVPGAVTVVAVLAGGTLLGVLGAIIAIPVAAGLLLLYQEVLVPRQGRL